MCFISTRIDPARPLRNTSEYTIMTGTYDIGINRCSTECTASVCLQRWRATHGPSRERLPHFIRERSYQYTVVKYSSLHSATPQPVGDSYAIAVLINSQLKLNNTANHEKKREKNRWTTFSPTSVFFKFIFSSGPSCFKIQA